MQKVVVPQTGAACISKPCSGQPSSCGASAAPVSRVRAARSNFVSVRAMQRAQSPSRRHALDRVSVPEAAPVSLHPDAIRRRQEAEKRRQSRLQYTQETASGKGWWEVQNPFNMHIVASSEEFKDRIRLAKADNSLVVVDYFAPWCHACKSLHPQLQKLATAYQDVTFLSVNAGVDSLKAMCDEIGVTRLPYFHFIKGEEGLVAEFSANLTAQKLQQLRLQIAQHRAT
ncbi:hypothetical protein ABBQ32_011432 [Trebouxia sp. C0010 RCD-2024]